jgi:hypothetical protein
MALTDTVDKILKFLTIRSEPQRDYIREARAYLEANGAVPVRSMDEVKPGVILACIDYWNMYPERTHIGFSRPTQELDKKDGSVFYGISGQWYLHQPFETSGIVSNRPLGKIFNNQSACDDNILYMVPEDSPLGIALLKKTTLANLGFGSKSSSLLDAIAGQAIAAKAGIEWRRTDGRTESFYPGESEYVINVCERGTLSRKEMDQIMEVYADNLKPEGDELANERAFFTDEAPYMVVINKGSKIVGFLSSKFFEEEGRLIHNFHGAAVGAEHRGRGLYSLGFKVRAALVDADVYQTRTKRESVLHSMSGLADIIGYQAYPGAEELPAGMEDQLFSYFFRGRFKSLADAPFDRSTMRWIGCYEHGDSDFGDGHDGQLCYVVRPGGLHNPI